MSKERKRKQDRNDRNPNSVMHPAQSIHSRESEIGLLGCMILNNEIIPSVICELEEDSFFMDSTRMIYSHILKVWDREKLVDLVMIKDSLGPPPGAPISGSFPGKAVNVNRLTPPSPYWIISGKTFRTTRSSRLQRRSGRYLPHRERRVSEKYSTKGSPCSKITGTRGWRCP